MLKTELKTQEKVNCDGNHIMFAITSTLLQNRHQVIHIRLHHVKIKFIKIFFG